ncbi:exodeoxyribonuclease V subunit beta [Haloquadratum walsbyi]|jgi:ATP-dependent exoDNAse (exonuclease V) beta subunit (contains helicase and exonuclease domains)|uniref:DNA 3'-5' helicase n=1 Tax=Haloquadratum walsbyi J07HQW2 TaxID=1238425 RepID=U1NCN1_9EURY|nr:UvrD-helicase domain-containing protein [Haloquadratum walsbyi]ERG94428.1 MAG: ATP-dependent exoDNAse (exonuclease V) beta subunit [Haloquadratum walsbyi J07HQW2]
MTTFDPNDNQERLITSIDGIYLVNAGAGTGKTFTITRRYVEILDQRAIKPNDILLLTFTRNAAAEMADRVSRYSEYDPVQLQDAPISTFHSYCHHLLQRYGYDSPSKLGIDEQLPESLDLIEDDIREQALFRGFMSRFEDAHPEYKELLTALNDPAALRTLIAELASKGVIPNKEGWYRDTGAVLQGDREDFFEVFEIQNQPNEGVYGPTQSDARSSLGDWKDAEYVPDAPVSDSFLDEHTVDPAVITAAFDEDRTQLVGFVHDLYFEYLEYAIGRNYLTQSLMLAMAFVMLCEEESIRQQLTHQYVMVDEFQDTNELQFKLSLLLTSKNNFCAVGDWKQSIYGFQYTEVENIQFFDRRLERFKTELNTDRQRISYSVDDINKIPLQKNYRSTASILSLARETLTIAGTQKEDIDSDAIRSDLTQLEATNHVDNSECHAYTHEDELELILDRIEHIVENPEYSVEVADEPAEDPGMTDLAAEAAEQERLGKPSYDDIAVFTRTRAFARDLLETARDYNIPVTYEGGVELFDTDQAKLLLAWLRIVETDSDRGWATVLEEAGYTLPEAKATLESGNFPPEMVSFHDELGEYDTLGGFGRHVFDAYGYDGAYADGLLAELTGMHETTLNTRGEAITFIEDSLEAETTVEIDTESGEDSVTLQTIHSAKGLEYPIVILGNINRHGFPNASNPSSSDIQYSDLLGLRQRNKYSTASGQAHVYSHWPYDVLSGCLPSEYDEERRLFYVAVTRAKRHLLLTAGETPSQFFTEFSLEPEEIKPNIQPKTASTAATDEFSITLPEEDRSVRLSVHNIMDDSIYQDVEDGRGTEFGNQVHDFAEEYANGQSVTPQSADEDHVAALLDSLSGEFITEITAILPLSGPSQITLVGIVDLLVETENRIEIIDYKTDRSRHAEPEYRKQLSVYYHIADEWYPDKDIRPTVFYTADDEQVTIEPLDRGTVRGIAEEIN